ASPKDGADWWGRPATTWPKPESATHLVSLGLRSTCTPPGSGVTATALAEPAPSTARTEAAPATSAPATMERTTRICVETCFRIDVRVPGTALRRALANGDHSMMSITIRASPAPIPQWFHKAL